MKNTNKFSQGGNRDAGKNKYIAVTVLLAVIICAVIVAYFYVASTFIKKVFFLAAAIGLITMLMLLLRQQKLLKKFSSIIAGSSKDEAVHKRSRSYDLENRLAMLVEERNELVSKVKLKEDYIRMRAVLKLLEGQPMEDNIRNLLPEFQGELSVLHVVYGKESLSADIASGVGEVAKELFSEIASVFFAENQTSGTLWMVADLKADVVNLKESIEKTSKRFINILKSRFDTDADVIYGRITENPEEISSVYREVKDAAFLCQKDGCVIDAEKIAERNYNVYNYSIDTEISIIIYIKKGDFARAYGLIRNALDEILYQRSYPIYIIRCFMFEIAGTILKAIGETEKENGINLGCSDNLNKIFFTESVIEMELILKEYLKEVCECISQNNKGVASPFCEKIKQYVRENYADIDMNVNAIAARFYINPAYLSNLFKRNTDIKLLDYINKVRIDEAKKMIIANPEITIEELSEKSGFKNSRTFRRIFLKYENISPSKFAKM